MLHLLRAGALALVLFSCAPQAAMAQGDAKGTMAPAIAAPVQAPCTRLSDVLCRPVSPDAPMPVATNGKQEVVALVTVNSAAAAQNVYGGTYVLAQACSAYGTLNLQVLGPDGSSYITLVSKTSSDSTGSTPVGLGSNAKVRVTLSGTTGCSASLSRVP